MLKSEPWPPTAVHCWPVSFAGEPLGTHFWLCPHLVHTILPLPLVSLFALWMWGFFVGSKIFLVNLSDLKSSQRWKLIRHVLKQALVNTQSSFTQIVRNLRLKIIETQWEWEPPQIHFLFKTTDSMVNGSYNRRKQNWNEKFLRY